MGKSGLQAIPGIGRTFVKDFARIGVFTVHDLAGREPEALFEALRVANAALGHPTSRNYLYVIRMAVYHANGGRDERKLKWHAWKG